jgi:hypothetical protein
VGKVLAGELPMENQTGRHLLEVVQSVPVIDAATIDKLYNGSFQVLYCTALRYMHDTPVLVTRMALTDDVLSVLQDLLMVTYLTNLTRTQMAMAEKLATTL